MRYLAIIPARGGSKSIPKKNIYPLGGKPLIVYTIEAALKSAYLDRIIVSTDCPEIASVASNHHVEVQIRPSVLSADNTPTLPVLNHVVNELMEGGYYPDVVCTLQPTSPFRTTLDIDNAIKLFNSHPDADSLVSCTQVPHQYVPSSLMIMSDKNYLLPYINTGKMILRRQDKQTLYARNGAALYLTRINCIKDFIFGGNCLPYIMDNENSLDIDEYKDILYAEHLLRIRKNNLI